MNENAVRILVVDDEQDLCDVLRFNLQAEGWEVATANSAEDALALDLTQFSLLLLDVMMGGISGFDLARRLKADVRTRHIPIIFITARDAEDDTVKGFEVGADDYISKPFSIREVVARIRAVLRRADPSAADPCIGFPGLCLDVERKAVTVDGQDVAFTKTEFELLRLLLERRGHVFSRQELIDAVWPSDVMVLDRTVDVNITRVRKKIGPYASMLATRQGYGYYFKN